MNRFAKNLNTAIDNLKDKRGERVNNDDIGLAIGTTGQNVWRWRSGKSKKVPVNFIDSLAKYLEVSRDWLENNDPNLIPTAVNMQAIGSKKALCKIDSFYMHLIKNDSVEAAIIDSQYRLVDLPAHLSNYLGLFATIAVNEQLTPRYEVGDVLIIAPQEAIYDGDYVIVSGKSAKGGYRAGRYIKQDMNNFELRCFENGAYGNVPFEASDVRVHKILNQNSLLNIEN